MTTVIKYSRTFSQSVALRRDTITVTIRVSFISPLVPSFNLWFDNIGDNLGGSKESNGPLIYGYTNFVLLTNLIPLSVQQDEVGDGTSTGCLRLWANGSTYPSATSPLTEVWKPILPGTYTELLFSAQYSVHPLATIGTIITLPTRVTPTSNTNHDANKLMIDLGSDFVLFINNNGEAGSSTLTITSGHN